MHSKIFSTLLIACNVTLAVVQAQGQPSEPRFTKADYINKFAEHAVAEMHNTGIPASITLAQGMLESDYGNSPLAKYAKNHFGIKCHKGWEGPSFIQDDDEANECFRKYYSEYDSYRDHSAFLTGRDRYASLFNLKPTDYKGWAHGLKKAGYATNPKYAFLLIKLMRQIICSSTIKWTRFLSLKWWNGSSV
jgi:flagellum-specific peptidoglycan hydrolase FlgJ